MLLKRWVLLLDQCAALASQFLIRMDPRPWPGPRLSKNLAKPQVYTYPAPDQEVATEYAFLKWRKSEFLAPGTFPKRDRPPLS